MTVKRIALVAGWGFLWLALSGAPAQASLPKLQRAWQVAHRDTVYSPPSQSEMTVWRNFWKSFWSQPTRPPLSVASAALQVVGFEIQSSNDRHGPIWIIQELAGRRRGSGFFLLRPQVSQGPLLQAPHGESDLHTAAIALDWFSSGHIAVLAINSTPRRRFDPARENFSFFAAMALEYASACPTQRIIQLHGFDASERQALDGTIPRVIFSSGVTRISPLLTRLVQAARANEPGVCLYPRDIHILGGTMNPLGSTLQTFGFSGFVHLEIDIALRKRLRRESAVRAQWLRYLLTP